jgi:hypothetical protein
VDFKGAIALKLFLYCRFLELSRNRFTGALKAVSVMHVGFQAGGQKAAESEIGASAQQVL